MITRLPVRSAAAVLGALVALVGCSSAGPGVEGQGFVSGTGVTELEPVDRMPAPDLEGELLGGGTYDLSEDRGDDIVVINVWGSWCAPCRAEAPALQEVYSELQDQGVQFLGINTRDTEGKAAAFVRTQGLTFPSLVDDGRLQAQFADSLPVAAIPTTIIIDRQGRVAARSLSEITYNGLHDLLDPLLDEPAGDAAGTAP